MPISSKIFLPCRSLGYVTNHIPLQVRYIKSRKENLIVTCVGKSFHTYGITHFGLLSVGGLHPNNITCMTADAFHVYTACDSVIYAWRRGTELKHTYKRHKKRVHLMLPFGPHLISIDEASVLKIWDIKAESLFLELTFNNASFQITTILHPSTYLNKILLGSEQGELQLWNVNNAKLIYTFKGWGSSVSCLEQAPALDVAAIGLANGRIILHNLKFDETVMEFSQDFGLVTCIAFRTDNFPVMATGSAAGHIVFWDLEDRRVTSQLLKAHDGPVTGMACLPNEPLIITSSPDNMLKLWIFDLSDGGARLLRIREGHSAAPSSVRFHGANGHNILSTAADSTLRIFNTQTEQFNKSMGKASYNRKASKKRGRLLDDPLIMPPIVQFTSEVTREREWDNIAAIHSGVPMVTTWSYDKVKMGDLKLLPERFKKKKLHPDCNVVANCLCLTHCGNFVVVGYSTGHVDRFNMQSGIWRDSYGNPKAHDYGIRGVASDQLNQIVISAGSSDCTLKFWKFKNKSSNSPLTQLTLEEPVNFLRSHRESSMLILAQENFDLVVVDLDTRRVIRQFQGHTAPITDATFSPDSRWLLTSSMDCSIRVWDIPSAKLVDQFATDIACISLDMSPNGEVLATAHVDCLGIFLWMNKTLYSRITLKAISPSDEPIMIDLPETLTEVCEEQEIKEEEPEYVSPDQISLDLATLSGLAMSRWANLLDLDTIKKRNKPKQAPKAPKTAPFFLPAVAPLSSFQFSMENDDNPKSKLLMPNMLENLTDFGKLLSEADDFGCVVKKLKTMSPSAIDFEVKTLAPDNGGSVKCMLKFLKCIEFMLMSNSDFELAEAYLGVFLKAHGNLIASEDKLRTYLPNIQSCHNVVWNRLQAKLMESICVVKSLKTL